MLYLVREPLERVSTKKSGMDGWEYALYIMVLAFTFEGLSVIIPSFCSMLTIVSRHHPSALFLSDPHSLLTFVTHTVLQTPPLCLLACSQFLERSLRNHRLSLHRCIRTPDGRSMAI